jgi:hypothetical protein
MGEGFCKLAGSVESVKAVMVLNGLPPLMRFSALASATCAPVAVGDMARDLFAYAASAARASCESELDRRLRLSFFL